MEPCSPSAYRFDPNMNQPGQFLGTQALAFHGFTELGRGHFRGLTPRGP